jgi:histone acetyltransferase (RNA polymerase elongator complex component)
MTAVKIAVSLPPEAVDAAKAAVRRHEARSVSAYVAAAMSTRPCARDAAWPCPQEPSVRLGATARSRCGSRDSSSRVARAVLPC